MLLTTAVDLKSCLLNVFAILVYKKVDNHIIKQDNVRFLFNIDRIGNMANTAQAKKRARQAEKSRIRNAGQRSNMRTFIKKVLAAIESGDKEQAQAAYKTAVPVIDTAVTKGLVHKNKAARNKSRLNTQVRAMA